MATVTVEAEVDIDEFDTDDILRELQYRIKHHSKITRFEIEKVKSICAEIIGHLGEESSMDSLMDTMKLELFMQGKDKKTLTDFENFFR